MRSFLPWMVSLLLAGEALSQTQPSADWPTPFYPTKRISEFMNFCTNSMVQKAQMSGEIVDAQVLLMKYTHQNICSCIMDHYRTNNSQEVFEKEFKASSLGDVPNFSNYLNKCIQISNNKLILKHGL